MVLVAGCGGLGPTPVPGSASPMAPASVAPASPTRPPRESPTPSPSTSPSPAVPSLVDPGLLDVLPADVDGRPLTPAPDVAAVIAADPAFRRDARGVAVGIVGELSATGESFAIATVVELAPGVFDDGMFATWRTEYDPPACEPAGGLADTSITEIGGRTVFVATCREGAWTLHVHVSAPDRILSVTAIGSRGLADALVAGLDPGG